MRFSIQEEGKEKQFFHTFFDAHKATGLDSRTIFVAIKREDSRYRRRSDKKVSFIKKELEDEEILVIDGKEFTSSNKSKIFLDCQQQGFSIKSNEKNKQFTDKDGNQHTVFSRSGKGF